MTSGGEGLIGLREVREDRGVEAYIRMGDEYLGALGYTEHGPRHAELVSEIAGRVLSELGYPERAAELARIAGYMHDMGNCVSRVNHGITAALLAKTVLWQLGMDPAEIAFVMNALGNHEEEHGTPTNPVGAATIIGDKADVHHTRVRCDDPEEFDIHDRVNHAAKSSRVTVDAEPREITLEIEIDTVEVQVMEYFEIFLSRMQMCRQAAEVLDARFSLVINGVKLL